MPPGALKDPDVLLAIAHFQLPALPGLRRNGPLQLRNGKLADVIMRVVNPWRVMLLLLFPGRARMVNKRCQDLKTARTRTPHGNPHYYSKL